KTRSGKGFAPRCGYITRCGLLGWVEQVHQEHQDNHSAAGGGEALVAQ
ncbi:MAG: hypothetical protein QG625_2812, partial [Cyanobacteriota bacterium erpe_2018_sw_39hr_WHONDRS-SW48-000098_B_bin.30]|nr:hypothetical protein [Cyanobacteriota bacterium erpe_2018_sw_39hr_WHONDRS-SW48-000098_B_bin.30]